MAFEVFGWNNLPKYEGVSLPREDKVERSGYVPAEKQILALLEAGERLDDFRRDYYEWDPTEEVPIDAVPGIVPADRADAFMQVQERAEKGVALAQEHARRAQAAEKKASPEPGTVEAPKGD